MKKIEPRVSTNRKYEIVFPKGSLQAIPTPETRSSISAFDDRVIIFQMDNDYYVCENQDDIQRSLDKMRGVWFPNNHVFNYYSLTREALYYTSLKEKKGGPNNYYTYIDNSNGREPNPILTLIGSILLIGLLKHALITYPKGPFQKRSNKHLFGNLTKEPLIDKAAFLKVYGTTAALACSLMYFQPIGLSLLIFGPFLTAGLAGLGISMIVDDWSPGFQFKADEVERFKASNYSADAMEQHDFRPEGPARGFTPLRDAARRDGARRDAAGEELAARAPERAERARMRT